MPAPCVFVVAEPDVHRALRRVEGLTVWADRFDGYGDFATAVSRGEIPLYLRPAVVVVSDALADGVDRFGPFLDGVADVALVVRSPNTALPPELPSVSRPWTQTDLVAAVWARAGVAPPPTSEPDLEPAAAPSPAEPMVARVVGAGEPAPVTVAARPYRGRCIAATTGRAATTSLSASTTAVAFALASRMALRGGHEVCVAGWHDDGGLLGALVQADGPTLADLMADLGDGRRDELTPEQVLGHQVRDSATGVRVLLPGAGVRLDEQPPATVDALVEALRQRCDVLLLDVPGGGPPEVADLAMGRAEAVAVVAERDQAGAPAVPGGTEPSTQAAAVPAQADVAVLVYDAEHQTRPTAELAEGPGNAGTTVAVLPTARREGLGHPGLRYVTGGESVEQALDGVAARLVPGVDLPPTALESEFWGKRVPRRRRRRR